MSELKVPAHISTTETAATPSLKPQPNIVKPQPQRLRGRAGAQLGGLEGADEVTGNRKVESKIRTSGTSKLAKFQAMRGSSEVDLDPVHGSPEIAAQESHNDMALVRTSVPSFGRASIDGGDRDANRAEARPILGNALGLRA
jgi:hypothetical protein